MSLVPAVPTAEGINLLFAPLGEDMDWQGYGLCAQPDQDPEKWFPERPDKALKGKKATKLCNQCMVRTECAEWALRVHEPYGIWGGLTEEDRRKYWRQQDQYESSHRQAS